MTTALGRTAVASRASMNMPACSSRRGLGTSALTVMVRPGSCTTGSTKSTWPVNVPAAQRGHPEGHLLADLELVGVALGHLERGPLRD